MAQQLKMSRGNEKIAGIQFPVGYYMRSFAKGDEEDWCKCCIDGSLDVEEISESAFEKRMFKDNSVVPENIYLLISPDGDVAGTVTYQYTDDIKTGCIHMVGIKGSHRGKGLAVPMLLYAIGKMIDDGKEQIILTTDDWRIPAIKSYFRTGFSPVIEPSDSEMQSRWRAVIEKTR